MFWWCKLNLPLNKRRMRIIDLNMINDWWLFLISYYPPIEKDPTIVYGGSCRTRIPLQSRLQFKYLIIGIWFTIGEENKLPVTELYWKIYEHTRILQLKLKTYTLIIQFQNLRIHISHSSPLQSYYM